MVYVLPWWWICPLSSKTIFVIIYHLTNINLMLSKNYHGFVMNAHTPFPTKHCKRHFEISESGTLTSLIEQSIYRLLKEKNTRLTLTTSKRLSMKLTQNTVNVNSFYKQGNELKRFFALWRKLIGWSLFILWGNWSYVQFT